MCWGRWVGQGTSSPKGQKGLSRTKVGKKSLQEPMWRPQVMCNQAAVRQERRLGGLPGTPLILHAPNAHGSIGPHSRSNNQYLLFSSQQAGPQRPQRSSSREKLPTQHTDLSNSFLPSAVGPGGEERQDCKTRVLIFFRFVQGPLCGQSMPFTDPSRARSPTAAAHRPRQPDPSVMPPPRQLTFMLGDHVSYVKLSPRRRYSTLLKDRDYVTFPPSLSFCGACGTRYTRPTQGTVRHPKILERNDTSDKWN